MMETKDYVPLQQLFDNLEVCPSFNLPYHAALVGILRIMLARIEELETQNGELSEKIRRALVEAGAIEPAAEDE